jgi:hypothetical protein
MSKTIDPIHPQARAKTEKGAEPTPIATNESIVTLELLFSIQQIVPCGA